MGKDFQRRFIRFSVNFNNETRSMIIKLFNLCSQDLAILNLGLNLGEIITIGVCSG